jgi:hypothetical protein
VEEGFIFFHLLRVEKADPKTADIISRRSRSDEKLGIGAGNVYFVEIIKIHFRDHHYFIKTLSIWH